MYLKNSIEQSEIFFISQAVYIFASAKKFVAIVGKIMLHVYKNTKIIGLALSSFCVGGLVVKERSAGWEGWVPGGETLPE